MNKKCFKCNIIKDINLFYKHKQMADGYLGKCKSCTKKDVKNRYNDPESKKKIVEYEKKRNQEQRRKEKQLEYQKKRRRKNPGKYRARTAVKNAIRDGRLVRKPCEVCGEIKVEGHHLDYRSKLKVVWLCFKHHRELHRQKL